MLLDIHMAAVMSYEKAHEDSIMVHDFGGRGNRPMNIFCHYF